MAIDRRSIMGKHGSSVQHSFLLSSMETDVPPQPSITEGVRPFDSVAFHFKIKGTAIGQRTSDQVSLDGVGAFAATHADFPASTILPAETITRSWARAFAAMRYSAFSSLQALGLTTHLDSPRQTPTGPLSDFGLAPLWPNSESPGLAREATTNAMETNLYFALAEADCAIIVTRSWSAKDSTVLGKSGGPPAQIRPSLSCSPIR